MEKGEGLGAGRPQCTAGPARPRPASMVCAASRQRLGCDPGRVGSGKRLAGGRAGRRGPTWKETAEKRPRHMNWLTLTSTASEQEATITTSAAAGARG